MGFAFPATADADWPIYGHDLSNSRSAGGDGPAKDAAGAMQRAWTFKSDNGDFTGTPVVAGGKLVAGTNLGSIFALDAVTGKLLWSRDVGEQINGTAAIDLNAPGGPTVFVPIAQVGSPRLLALSLATGEVRWDTVLTRQAGSDVFGSPVFWQGTVYIGTSGPNNDETTARGSVVALNEATGATRWQTYTVPPGHDGGAVWSTPAIDTATGRLYVGTGNAYHEPAADTTDAILVLDAQSGDLLGHHQTTANDVWQASSPLEGPDHDFGASANLITGPDGRALVGEGSKSGVYWALDRATMKPVWSTSVGPGSAVGGILASTAYDGTRIYGNDTVDAQIWALGLDGSKQWDSTDGGTLDFNPVSVSNGVLYSAGSSGFLTARDPATGSVLGKMPLDGPAFGGISVVGGAVYVATGTGPPPQVPGAPDYSKAVGNGSIIGFGDTSRSGASGAAPASPAAPGTHAEAPSRRGRRAIQLSVRPRDVRPRRVVRFRFSARRGSRPLSRVTIRLAGHRTRTNRRGRAAMRVRLPRSGTYVARASRRGLAGGRATILAGRHTKARRGGAGGNGTSGPGSTGDTQRNDGGSQPAMKFSGRCRFSGSVYFQPAMTNTPQSVTQRVEAPGTCSGTLVDRAGHEHELSDAPVTFSETSQATNSSCASGTATGSGSFAFEWGELRFGFSETRVGALPFVTLSGAAGGTATGSATPTSNQDPAAALQACGGAGLERFDLDIYAATAPEISG